MDNDLLEKFASFHQGHAALMAIVLYLTLKDKTPSALPISVVSAGALYYYMSQYGHKLP